MNNFYKIVIAGFIDGVGTNGSDVTPISEDEYNTILAVIHDKPKAENGYEYKLRADNLEWELVELPSEDEDATAEDYETALGRFGV